MTSRKALKTIFPLLIISSAASAQQASNTPFVLPQFVNGTVLQKGGGAVQASLDYNTITQEMMFEKDGGRLILDQVDNIDTVYLESRKFIPAKQGFYEKLTNTAIPLYVQYKGTTYKSGSTVGSGGGDNNSAISGFIGVKQANKGSSKTDPYALKLPDGYALKTENIFWLQKDKQFYPATDLKKVIKLFPGKESQIADFVKQNNTSFAQVSDMQKLIEFCNK